MASSENSKMLEDVDISNRTRLRVKVEIDINFPFDGWALANQRQRIRILCLLFSHKRLSDVCYGCGMLGHCAQLCSIYVSPNAPPFTYLHESKDVYGSMEASLNLSSSPLTTVHVSFNNVDG